MISSFEQAAIRRLQLSSYFHVNISLRSVSNTQSNTFEENATNDLIMFLNFQNGLV